MRQFKQFIPMSFAGLLALSLFANSAFAQSSYGHYRWPNLHGDTLVMAAEGDLWRGSLANGQAIRLTTHTEEEVSPILSPDGLYVAFAASYDAAREIYVMPVAGGAPKQVSFSGGAVAVRGWTPDGRVLYVTTLVGRPTGRTLVMVDPNTLRSEELPLTNANAASFSGDGKTVFFTRLGLANNADNVKLYRGGGMAQLWRFTLGSGQEAKRLAADFGAPIRHPMWREGRVYFVSDKNGHSNIWSMDEAGKGLAQHTQFTDWQVRTPRLHNGQITFQRGSDIHVYDIAAAQERKLDISLVSDRDSRRERWLQNPLSFLTSAALSPKGDRVALTARGKIALVSSNPLRRAELNIPTHGRARGAVISADGKSVYAMIDDGVRGEIWRYPADGIGQATQITENASAHRWRINPSPHGKYLLHDDDNARIWLYNIEADTHQLLDQSDGFSGAAFVGVAWSSDNRYVAYEKTNQQGITQIVIADVQTLHKQTVTLDKFQSYSPAFSTDGNWLYFLSDRTFNATPSSPWGDRNMGTHFDKRTKIYALALNLEARFAFQAEDELMQEDDKEEENNDNKDKKEDEKTVEIVWNGLADRLYEVPSPAGNFSQLKTNETFLYFLDRTGRDLNLKSLKIDDLDPSIKTFAAKLADYDLSADGKQLFYRVAGRGKEAQMFIVKAEATAPKDTSAARLFTKDWKIALNPSDEWRQMYADAWRLHRDLAFDPNLRGLDWDAVRAKYEPLVSRIGHRAELDDVLAQMVSELGILHSQVRGNDFPTDKEKGVVASLGANYAPTNTGLRVVEIYRGEPHVPTAQSPLGIAAVDVRVGDIIQTVNGRAITNEADLYEALLYQAGQQVILTMQRGRNTAHKVIVKPVSAGANRRLLYSNWVESRRDLVRDIGQGELGYLHMRAMGGGDAANFARDFYEHTTKGGLIIDVRGNRGGNIDSWILQALLREVWSFWHFEGRDVPYGNMQQTFRGHLVVLMDAGTYSDGETFAAGIKALDLAPVFGTRSAGAGIWLSNRSRLSDGGIARIAESAQFGLDGRWLIEGRGIDPDRIVENLPHAAYLGEDAQLQAAIAYLQQKLAEQPIPAFKAIPIPPVGENGHDVQRGAN